jgi:DNA polymerase-3 subunit gamma/tau
VNCGNIIGANPCNKCDICIEITNGTSIDVIEIDGASNRGIDEIRGLREAAKFLPAYCKYKVYIIDEVHMLTEPAFNALLKILEEPPPHVIFIMATTEHHRIPMTILSRCQIFTFKKIGYDEMYKNLTDILIKESVEFDSEAIPLIIRNADGCLRDALGVIDQAIAFSSGKLQLESLNCILGKEEKKMVNLLLESIIKEDTRSLPQLFDDINSAALEYNYIIEELLNYSKHLLLYMNAGIFNEKNLLKEEVAFLKDILPYCNKQKLFLIYQILLKLISDIKLFTFDRYIFEIGILKASNATKLIPSHLVESSAPYDKININIKEKDSNVDKKEEKKLFESFDDETWRKFLNILGKLKPNLSINLSYGYIMESTVDTLKIAYTNTKKFYYSIVKKPENFTFIKDLVLKHFSNINHFEIHLDKNGGNEKKAFIEEAQELETYNELKIKKDAESNPIVKKILKEFNGQIIDTKIYGEDKEDLI